jgi:hypothetical protein
VAALACEDELEVLVLRFPVVGTNVLKVGSKTLIQPVGCIARTAPCHDMKCMQGTQHHAMTHGVHARHTYTCVQPNNQVELDKCNQVTSVRHTQLSNQALSGMITSIVSALRWCTCTQLFALMTAVQHVQHVRVAACRQWQRSEAASSWQSLMQHTTWPCAAMCSHVQLRAAPTTTPQSERM